ncbi:uncharacterized protein NPIL_584491, partial [Nephila pilipes]
NVTVERKGHVHLTGLLIHSVLVIMECNCGKHSTSCKYDNQGKKLCECKSGYLSKNDTCTEKKKDLMVYSIQREFKLNEVFKFYGFSL